MEKNRKEQWIDDAMAGIDNIGRAKANPFLYSKVISRLQTPAAPLSLRPRIAWLAAAGVVLLVGLNVLSCLHFENTNTTSERNGRNAFAAEYFSFVNNNAQF